MRDQELLSRQEKILYSRKFFRESTIYRGIIERLVNLVVGAGGVRSSVPMLPRQLVEQSIKEFFLTGEICFFLGDELQLLESEKIKIENQKIIYDDEFEIKKNFFILKNQLRPTALRGEPPLAAALLWIARLASLQYAQVRAADLCTRMLARIVSPLRGDEDGAEFDLSDEFLIMRSSNPADIVEFPKYSPPDFSTHIKNIQNLVAGCIGLPSEVVWCAYGDLSFSGAKAVWLDGLIWVEKHRQKFLDFYREIFPNLGLAWGTLKTPADLDMAKIKQIEMEANDE